MAITVAEMLGGTRNVTFYALRTKCFDIVHVQKRVDTDFCGYFTTQTVP
jgi:hypothetical protein